MLFDYSNHVYPAVPSTLCANLITALLHAHHLSLEQASKDPRYSKLLDMNACGMQLVQSLNYENTIACCT